jgi:ribosome biogenesis GTPase / thiamine phosphate phosphatase
MEVNLVEMKNEDLGYDDFFESNFKKLKLNGFSVARVMAEHKGLYKIKNSRGEYLAKVTGKQIYSASAREDYPAVGDWVVITDLGDEKAVIHTILPRRTIIKRKYINKSDAQIIATNIDVAFVVESVDRDFNLNRLERYLTLADAGGVKSTIILNKIDLILSEELNIKLAQVKNRFKDIDIITTSIKNNSGLNELKKYILRGKTYCFLGSSGVGKSSLINILLGENAIDTKDISFKTNKGKHTTTSREMYFLKNGGIVIDNPGMREVGLTDTDTGINNIFDEITILAKGCKFVDCSHISEPGCAVLLALESGELDAEKYSNYINLKKESEYYSMSELERKEKDRQFGKFIKKAKEEIKRFDY